MAKTVYVRVQPKTATTHFFRCNILFTLLWQPFELDAATIQRLHEEQMLQVSDTEPEDYVKPDTAAENSDQPKVAIAPEDQAERHTAIKAAIQSLDIANTALWTNGGAPKTDAISAVTGWPVSAADRDTVWSEIAKAA